MTTGKSKSYAITKNGWLSRGLWVLFPFVLTLTVWTLYLAQADLPVFSNPEVSSMEKWKTWLGLPLLAGCLARGRKTGPIDGVVQAAVQINQELRTGDGAAAQGWLLVAAELGLDRGPKEATGVAAHELGGARRGGGVAARVEG